MALVCVWSCNKIAKMENILFVRTLNVIAKFTGTCYGLIASLCAPWMVAMTAESAHECTGTSYDCTS